VHRTELDTIFPHGSFRLYPLVEAALTPREQVIATCLINGIRPHIIPTLLNVAPRTIKWQIKLLSLKLGLLTAGKVEIIRILAPLSEWQPALAKSERSIAA
jgi:DNA-binding NarL/FixJ family response regulator